MNYKTFLINQFAKLMMNGLIWARLKHLVELINDADLTGAEKRNTVIQDVKTIGLEISGFMLNLAIELAVAYFKVGERA